MSIIIVARTQMAENYRCIGGLIDSQTWKNNYLNSIRLLTANGNHFRDAVDFDVGEFWDVNFRYSRDTDPPHSEDVLVHDYTYERDCDDLAAFLREHRSRLAELNRWWEGSPDTLFEARIEARDSGTGYISRADVPEMSTGFWVPDRDLRKQTYEDTVRYIYPGSSSVNQLTYVGTDDLPSTIPEGSLCRVSLARWWSPNPGDPERCYLQLSDAYLGHERSSTTQDDGSEEAFDPDDDLPF